MGGESIPNEIRVVRDALRSLGYASAYDAPVSPRVCCEPIVVSMTDWERETLQADGSERGRRDLVAHVVCDDWADARVTSREVARQLCSFDWAHAASPERMRIAACDAQMVTIDGTDASKDVALGSDFFSLAPGTCEPAFSGCSGHTVSWTERWA